MARLNRKVEDNLVDEALAAQRAAYAPYSRFFVGACALAVDGRTFRGCNVENVAYPVCVCAERNAIGSAAVAGVREIAAIAIVTSSSPPSPPCGACRQVLAEFAAKKTGDIDIVLANADGERVRTTLKKLFPSTFTSTLLSSGQRAKTGKTGAKKRAAE